MILRRPESDGGRPLRTLIGFSLALILASLVGIGGANGASPIYRLDHVVDGDTIALRNGQRVRLVQIDTPEVYFHTECYGRAASQITKRPVVSTVLPLEQVAEAHKLLEAGHIQGKLVLAIRT